MSAPGALGSLRPCPHKFKIFTYFHIILHCKTPENHVKSSFHDCCYRHFFFESVVNVSVYLAISAKSPQNALFLLLFKKILLDKNYGGKCPCPQMTSLQDCGGLLQCLQGHDP